MKLSTEFTAVTAIFFSVFFIFSCSSKQEIAINISGEGVGMMEIALHPILTSYLTDLAMVMTDTENPEDLPIFDEIGIWNAFAGNESVELLSVEIPERERLQLRWRFSDLNEPFSMYDESEQKVISFYEDGSKRSFRFHLSTENFHQVSRYFPLIDEDLLAYFGPNTDDPVPEDIYKEDLEFALEDYLGNQTMEEILEGSVVTLLVKTEGRIVSSNGGRMTDAGVVFETPLIKFLTLNEPVSYQLVFTE